MAISQPLELHSLTDQAATNDGNWADVRSFRRFSVHVKGIVNATVSIYGSNAPVKPSDAIHEIELTSTTVDVIADIDLPVKWLKVRVSAWVDGTINAYTWATE